VRSATTNKPIDLAVRSDRIFTEGGWIDGTIAVSDGRIVDVTSVPVEAVEQIDAVGRVVLPGLVDTHAHFRDPGFTDKEDFETGTRSAVAGGVTTVFDMPNVTPVTNTVDRFAAHIANAAGKSLIDFGHNASATIPENIGALADAGATAFKIFMMTDIGRDYPHMPGTAENNHGQLLRICEEVAKTGKPLYVHPHDQEVYEVSVQRAQDRWGMDYRSYARAWRDNDGLVLDLGIATMIELQRVTGVRLHVLHVSKIHGLQLIADAKARGQEVTLEINPFSMFLSNSWDTVERLGPYSLGMWVPDDHAQAVWESVLDGSADVIATDHSPHTKEEKEIGWTNMYACPGGSPTIQHYLSLLLDACSRGQLSVERVAELCSTNPAKLVGLYPRKGAIAARADADLVIVDLDRTATISAATSHYKSGWTPFEGRQVTGVPVTTIQRGRVLMDEERILAEPGDGQFIGAMKTSPTERVIGA
jgi:dihydroorotase